jgi:excinuclease ABC subunit B
VSLVAILDADKEGFLRSETSLVQTIGRAARNVEGRVILYADHSTDALDRAITETQRRRTLQEEFNRVHGITPSTVKKRIADITEGMEDAHGKAVRSLALLDRAAYEMKPEEVIREKEQQMEDAVAALDFETAAIVRDEIIALTGGAPTRKKGRKRITR